MLILGEWDQVTHDRRSKGRSKLPSGMGRCRSVCWIPVRIRIGSKKQPFPDYTRLILEKG